MPIFKHSIQTSQDIDAAPAVVWRILTDLHDYAEWNPMLSDVESSLTRGAEVRFKAARPDGGSLSLKARVTSLLPHSELVWKGGQDLLLSGEHYFRLHESSTGGCRFEHGECFRGLLVPLVRPFLMKGRRVYQAMNDALKSRAEFSTRKES